MREGEWSLSGGSTRYGFDFLWNTRIPTTFATKRPPFPTCCSAPRTTVQLELICWKKRSQKSSIRRPMPGGLQDWPPFLLVVPSPHTLIGIRETLSSLICSKCWGQIIKELFMSKYRKPFQPMFNPVRAYYEDAMSHQAHEKPSPLTLGVWQRDLYKQYPGAVIHLCSVHYDKLHVKSVSNGFHHRFLHDMAWIMGAQTVLWQLCPLRRRVLQGIRNLIIDEAKQSLGLLLFLQVKCDIISKGYRGM